MVVGIGTNNLKTYLRIQNVLQQYFLVDKVECNFDTEEGQQVFKNYNAMAIEKGFEGIMIKDRNAPYECKRSHFMLKAKPFIEVF